MGIGGGTAELLELEIRIGKVVKSTVWFCFAAEHLVRDGAEEWRRNIAGLHGKGGEVNGAALNARGGAGFEAV